MLEYFLRQPLDILFLRVRPLVMMYDVGKSQEKVIGSPGIVREAYRVEDGCCGRDPFINHMVYLQ